MTRIISTIFFCIAAHVMTAQPQTLHTGVESPVALHTGTGDLFGTLTVPVKTHSAMPVVIIIAGSGPTDRDCNNPMMKNDAYKKLALALSDRKIASIRYDKRGIAASAAAAKSEADLRFEDYINDAKAWIQFLKQDERFSEIIVLGHSEGSLIGMLASTTDVQKFVSLAGPGTSADKLLKEQLSGQPAVVKDPSYVMIDSLKKGMPVTDVPQMLYSLFRPSLQPYMMSWFRYDPAQSIKMLTIPVLILQGSNDLQVKVDDAEKLHQANPASTLVIIEGMNHILRKVSTDKTENVRTYNDASLPIDETLVQSLTGFILNKN